MSPNDPEAPGNDTPGRSHTVLPRREFLKQAATALGAVTPVGHWAGAEAANTPADHPDAAATEAEPSGSTETIAFPRVFRGSKLKMISFPLGGVGAGSLGLGGRGQLRDWEIFNRPNRGFFPDYAFPALWVQSGDEPPRAHVLEARILPPYEGEDGLGSRNAPGLTRLKTATFTGEFPLAHIDFEDPGVPVAIGLDAFSPFIPHVPDDSGLPVAVLRYRVHNPGRAPVKVSIAFSIDNPVLNGATSASASRDLQEKRVNAHRSDPSLEALFMTNPGLEQDDPLHGSFALGAIPASGVRLTWWRGWPKGSWWNSPLLFWDAFSKAGQMNDEPPERNKVGVLCQSRTILPGHSGDFTFLLAWHFPNRTPEWCGWSAPKGKEDTVIGNFYATRFADAWEAAVYTARHLPSLEQKTRAFAQTLRESTLPAEVREAASANLSTLASTTCFRTADGDFHGFEGSDDHLGCCYGNCTHVWNYETATAFLFPSFARSLRKASFGYSEDEEGGIHARQMLPDGEARDGIIAADGHMGQIMHAYLDWRLSGDDAWLKTIWPRVRQAMAFAWVSNGWDPQQSGVTTGVQNNTYDVAFFGPNPLCSIYYLGALRAAEEMALASGNESSAHQYRSLFERGRQWIEANLFNGEFFIQQIRRFSRDEIHPSLRIGASGFNPEDPQFQVGAGCLIDQLMGQYLASIMQLGPLISAEHLRTTLRSIYRCNYKRTLVDHDNVERTFALNDESAMVICDYGTAPRPRIPFPYFAEVMTGFEHATAALMIASGMLNEGTECIRNVRARYDGEKRNPWDEAECGHHYARAMASWSSIVILSGFDYDGQHSAIRALPPFRQDDFRSLWSNGTGWGNFSYSHAGVASRFELKVIVGTLSCRSCEIHGSGSTTTAIRAGIRLPHSIDSSTGTTTFRFDQPQILREGDVLQLEVRA